MNAYVAGSFSGLSGVLIGHPWDTVKIQMQTNPELKGIRQTISYIYKNDGMKGFFRGIMPPLYGSTAVTAFCFGLYNNSLTALNKKSDNLIFNSFAAGTVVGISTTIAITPSDLVKTKLQLQSGKEQVYSSEIDCFRKILKSTGIRGLFKGGFPTFVREFCGYGVYFSTYEYFHRAFGDSPLALLNAGGFAGIVRSIMPHLVVVMDLCISI